MSKYYPMLIHSTKIITFRVVFRIDLTILIRRLNKTFNTGFLVRTHGHT